MSGPITDNEADTGQGKSDTGTSAAPKVPWPDSDEDTLARVNKCRRRADSDLTDWYNQARVCFEFAESKQWTEEDQEKMADDHRIAVTFNRIAPIINAICGQEVANRQEVRYLPRRVGPVNAADPLNDAVKWVREQCNAEDEDSDAFRDMVICGMGWTVSKMDYDVNPEGMPDITRRDPFLMRWDTTARRKNLADAKWMQADYWLPKETIEQRWPDADIDGLQITSSTNDRTQPHDATEAWRYKENATGMDLVDDRYRVIHHVERYGIATYRLVDPSSGQAQDFSQQEYQTLQEHAEAQDIKLPEAVSRAKRVYWEAWTCGKQVLKCGVATAQTEFPYQAMTCYRERDTGYWFGPVQLMLDPQRYANRMMSLMMSVLSTGAKGGLVFETGAFANSKKAKAEWARYDSAVEVNPGYLDKIRPKETVNMPPGASDLMQFAIGSIRDCVGVNIELLGQQNNNQTGVVEDMKTKAGLTILAPVFDAKRLYVKRQGLILAEYVQRFISDGRLVRIMGPLGEQFVPLLRGPDVMEYDVVVDESAASRDVKERTFVVLSSILPMAMQAGIPLPDELLDYAPLPQSLVMAWKKKIADQKQQQAAQGPPPNPLVQVEQMKGQTLLQIEQLKQQGQAGAEQARAQATMQTEQARVQADIQIQQHKIATDAQLEQAKNQATLALQNALHQRDTEKEIAIANIKAASAVEVARINAGIDAGTLLLQQEAQRAGYGMNVSPAALG